MALGTGPERLVPLLQDNWQASRVGRDDIPDVVRDNQGNPSSSGDDGKGVLIVNDRENVGHDSSFHDLIHCYHPEANPPTSQDTGYKEEQLIETVQIDVELTDRTDHSQPAGSKRLSARERLVGERGDLADFDQPPYPGVLGEVKYILETVRRGLDEWDKVSYDFVNLYLGNSNADASVVVELEQIARNTVQ